MASNEEPHPQTAPTLRSLVFRGGTYLAIRQAAGIFLGVLGPIFLLREIGPSNYGLYAAALSVLTYVQIVSQWGIEVYLMRHPEGENRPEVYHQAFTILLVTTAAGAAILLAVLPWLDRWMRLPELDLVVWAVLATLPLLTLRQVPVAQLERKLDYKHIVIVELCGQVCFYAVALPLAFKDRDVWSPVTGWCCQQVLVFVLFFAIARYRPSLHYEPKLIRRILGYGLGYSSSVWIWQIRSLVNPVVVGRYAGIQAVGFVALAIRIVDVLSFARSAAWRISIAALARLQGSLERLLRAINEGMRLQIIVIGPPLTIFSLVGVIVLGRVFGPQWLPAMAVYPFIAFGALTNSAFTMESSSLFVLQRNWQVATFSAAHLVSFAAFALVLVPRFGMIGYGWAEMAALPAYVILHRFTVRHISTPEYLTAFVWWVAFGLAVFEPVLGWGSLSGLLLIVLWPRSRHYCARYARDAWLAIGRT